MGRRGPLPEPTRLKVLKGGSKHTHRPLPVHEPQPAMLLPSRPPAVLRGEAATLWRRLAPRLHRLGLLTELDQEALVLLCSSWARWCQAEAAVQRSLEASGRFNRLKVLIANRYAAQFRGLAAEFGLSPAARVRLASGSDSGTDDAAGVLS